MSNVSTHVRVLRDAGLVVTSHGLGVWRQHRAAGGGPAQLFGGLVLLIFGLVRAGRVSLAPFAVGAYITAAYWWPSSTSFANPMVTISRTLSDTFAGISPASVPA